MPACPRFLACPVQRAFSLSSDSHSPRVRRPAAEPPTGGGIGHSRRAGSCAVQNAVRPRGGRRLVGTRALGRRPGLWPRNDRDRHSGGTLHPLRDAGRVTRRAQGRTGRRRAGRDHPDPSASAGPFVDLGTRATRWPNIFAAASPPAWLSTSVTRKVRSVEAATKTPTAYCGQYLPEQPTCRPSPKTSSTR